MGVVRKARKDWGTWERRIQADCGLQNFECSRIPEEVVALYSSHPKKVKSDVDFVIGIDGHACWLDAKSTNEPLFNIKHYVLRNDSHASKIHQWSKLLSAHKRGNFAGYLIWFIKLGKITWVSVPAIELALKENRPSIHPESPLCTSQKDDTQIFFRRLIWGPTTP